MFCRGRWVFLLELSIVFFFFKMPKVVDELLQRCTAYNIGGYFISRSHVGQSGCLQAYFKIN